MSKKLSIQFQEKIELPFQFGHKKAFWEYQILLTQILLANNLEK